MSTPYYWCEHCHQGPPVDVELDPVKLLAGLTVTTKAVERTAEAIGEDIGVDCMAVGRGMKLGGGGWARAEKQAGIRRRSRMDAGIRRSCIFPAPSKSSSSITLASTSGIYPPNSIPGYPAGQRRWVMVRKDKLDEGKIEAGCKTVLGRLKQSGMFWTVRGANAIIAPYPTP